MLTISLGVAIIVLLIVLVTLEVRGNNAIMTKLNTVSAPLSYLEQQEKNRQTAYEARKNWRTYRENNLPRQTTPRMSRTNTLSREELQRQADELEQNIKI